MSKVVTRCKHYSRVVYNNGEPTDVRWCSKCGAIYHKTRRKRNGWTKRAVWHPPHGGFSWRKDVLTCPNPNK